MRDDAVRVVAEDVFAGWGEFLGAVQARGEVGGEEGPDAEGAEVGRPSGQGAGAAGCGEQEVQGVGQEEGPEERDGAEGEEGCEEEGDAEGVEEDDEGLESSFEGHVEGGEADAGEEGRVRGQFASGWWERGDVPAAFPACAGSSPAHELGWLDLFPLVLFIFSDSLVVVVGLHAGQSLPAPIPVSFDQQALSTALLGHAIDAQGAVPLVRSSHRTARSVVFSFANVLRGCVGIEAAMA